ncbi:thiamine diphosphokinase [Amaricoccus solimangrovi]|uniref:Thiamine diphosphokinase n=1 Tax=Amaricoccus solimangrovi TaxID=2589815 RepID=A0A501WXU0_9RHOB|nr:thiamine diphosphokinase [Amaricoccus solimangrovi]TPE53542.1 thiamine diphosphokinase [Amaricoccus solimangrovi]
MELRPVLYRAAGPVTLVGGGPVTPAALAAALALAPEVYAADGGGDVALPAGHRLRAIIGDIDSLGSDPAREGAPPVHRIAEQDTTDLEKCLYSIEAPLYLGVGFLGGRVDHELAALNALARHPERRMILIGESDLCLRCPEAGLRLSAEAGERVSLFPMGPARGTRSVGLTWPVTDLELAPAGRIGTSNSALGGPLEIGFSGGPVLVILPVGHLGQVTRSLG